MLSGWQQWFPGAKPIAYLLRTSFPDRWVRFHSLPESKRYPEDEAEYAMVLARHNRILGELSGSGEEVVLLTTEYSDTPEPARLQPALKVLDTYADPWRSVAMHVVNQDFDDQTFWHVFASSWEWRPGLFDPIVRLTAVDALANVMIVAPDCRWLLHPYDGGMDVFAESSTARDRLKSSYACWLPKNKEGL